MRKSKFNFSLYVLAILLFMSVAIANAAPQEANFVGTWNLTVAGGQGGGGHQGGDQSEAKVKVAGIVAAVARSPSQSPRTATISRLTTKLHAVT